MDPKPLTTYTGNQKRDADGKPTMPLCRKCGIPAGECVEAKSHPPGPLSKSNRVRFRRWQERLKEWESGVIYIHPLKGRKLSQEHKDKVGAAGLNRKTSQETKEKQRAAKLGRKFSQSHRDKIRDANLGRKHSQEHKNKVRVANSGKERSQEHRDRLRVSNLGKKRSQETRRRMSIVRRELRSADAMNSVKREKEALKRLAALTKIS